MEFKIGQVVSWDHGITLEIGKPTQILKAFGVVLSVDETAIRVAYGQHVTMIHRTSKSLELVNTEGRGALLWGYASGVYEVSSAYAIHFSLSKLETALYDACQPIVLSQSTDSYDIRLSTAVHLAIRSVIYDPVEKVRLETYAQSMAGGIPVDGWTSLCKNNPVIAYLLMTILEEIPVPDKDTFPLPSEAVAMFIKSILTKAGYQIPDLK